MSLNFSRNRLLENIGAMPLLFALFIICSSASSADTTVQPQTKKFGYFDLKVIRNTFPDSVAFEQARYTGEDRLRGTAAMANQQLKQFQDENHSEGEIQKEREKLQSAVDTKTGSFVRQMLATNLNITEKIKQAAMTTAEARGVDVILDANAVFFGGGKILQGGVDVTADMMKILGTEPSE